MSKHNVPNSTKYLNVHKHVLVCKSSYYLTQNGLQKYFLFYANWWIMEQRQFTHNILESLMILFCRMNQNLEYVEISIKTHDVNLI